MPVSQDWRRARVTLWLAGVTAFAWALEASTGRVEWAALWGGFIPIRVTGLAGDEWFAPVVLTPLTATLVHADFWHLLLNMLFLLACGRAVEMIVGGRQLLILYLVGAYVAAAAHYAVDPSGQAPAVGASGAISAVIGAYGMISGRNRLRIANRRAAVWLNALWLVVIWTLLQVIVGLSFGAVGMRIAVAEHVGGFIAGLLLAKPMLLLRYRGA